MAPKAIWWLSETVEPGGQPCLNSLSHGIWVTDTGEAERVLSRTSGGSLALPQSGPRTGLPELGVHMFLWWKPLRVCSGLLQASLGWTAGSEH